MKKYLFMNISKIAMLLNVILLLGSILVLPTVASESSANFSWVPNSESNIVGYKINYGTTADGVYPNFVDINNNVPDPTDGRMHGTVTGLTDGITYYFVCTACNDLGIKSDFSSQIIHTAGSMTKIFGESTNNDYPGTLSDTFINVNQNNENSNTQIMTYTWPENTVTNAILMQADLSQLPTDVQIQKATLYLYLTNSGGDAGYDISVHKIINHKPDLTSATGYTYDGTNGWTANSSCYNNVPMAQADIEAAEDTITVDQVLGYKSWVVTEMVKNWINAPSTNFGLLLNADAVATSDSSRTFASSDKADPALRPKLTITYTLMATPTILSVQIK